MSKLSQRDKKNLTNFFIKKEFELREKDQQIENTEKRENEEERAILQSKIEKLQDQIFNFK